MMPAMPLLPQLLLPSCQRVHECPDAPDAEFGIPGVYFNTHSRDAWEPGEERGEIGRRSQVCSRARS